MSETISLLSMESLQTLSKLAWKTPPGCFVEVGVYQGGSAAFLHQIAIEQRRDLHLFDTFEGIPFCGEFDDHAVGDFGDVDFTKIQKMFPRARLYRGIFPQTLPAHITRIAFAHIDCDQYQSIKDCIEHLYPRMVEGGIMLFDDYDQLQSAHKAIGEFFEELFCTPQNKVFAVKGITVLK